MDGSPAERRKSVGGGGERTFFQRPILALEDFAQSDVLLYTPLGSWIERHKELIAAALTGAFLLSASIAESSSAGGPAISAVSSIFYFLAFLFGSYYGLKEAWRSLGERSLDINVLMVAGAFLAAGIGRPAEGGFLLFLFTLSAALEGLAGERTTLALRAITKIMPTEAMVLRPGGAVKARLREVRVGERILVRPGDRVPLDGTVIDGRSLIDESSITGESTPRSKGPGDAVYAGAINQDGTLTIETTKPYHDTALEKIKRLVVEAQEEKVRAQRLFDRFGRAYAAAVISASLAFGLALWLLLGKSGAESTYRSITLLIVASPCALILSVPTAALSALARAARAGILIKGGARLEELARIEALVFDKTGTLTTGEARLQEVRSLRGFSEDEVLLTAAALERSASHPLARAVLERAEELGAAIPEARDVVNIPGVGFRGMIGGETAFVGRPGAPLTEIPEEDRRAVEEAAAPLRRTGCAVAAVHRGSRLGLLAFRDALRPEAKSAMETLRRAGLKKILLLTGDSAEAASAASAELGLDGFLAGLLPEGKVEAVKALAASGEPVAMVGDGVNDAPALKAATVGIAMGAIGSNVAMEAADVVLLRDDISKLPFLFALARTARRTMALNLGFASAVILALALTTVLEGMPLSLGVLGHEGSTLLVVANSLRLLLFRQPR